MRRYHRKTRTGCTQCKKRRIKCDEGKPSCKSCMRNFLGCSLGFLMPSKPKMRQANIARSSIAIPLSMSSPSTSDNHLLCTSLDVRHRELLHHYTSTASLEFGQTQFNELWQVMIPRIAVSYDFLMHGIIAISALHLSRRQSNRKIELLQVAMHSENSALPSFRQLLATNHPDTIHAVFIFAGFVVPYMLATFDPFDDKNCLPGPGHGQPHWFHSMRGMISWLTRKWQVIAQGPFSAWLARSDPLDLSRNPDDIHLAKIHNLLSSEESLSSLGSEDVASCQEALDELRRVMAAPYAPNPIVGMVCAAYVWPGTVPQRYVQLLHRRRPESLVILAHYCVLLKRVNSCWYFEGVGEGMLNAVQRILGVEWEPWIEWAIKQESR